MCLSFDTAPLGDRPEELLSQAVLQSATSIFNLVRITL